MNLSELRNRIDAIDHALVPLFLQRMEVSRQIAEIKSALGLPIRNPEREAEVLQQVTDCSPEALRVPVRELYEIIMRLSRDYQAQFCPESLPEAETGRPRG